MEYQIAMVKHLSEVKKILRLCGEYGIFFIDTAPSYGNSEELIGNYLADGFKIITKTYCQSKNGDEIKPRSSLNESLEKLNNCSIYGLLFHNSETCFLEMVKCFFAMPSS